MNPLRRHAARLCLGLIALLYVAAAWALTYGARSIQGDNFSRIANAFYVLYSRDPHLAAVGFVWNPLPSLLDLPLLVVLRPFGLALLAGPLQSALWSVANVALMARILRQIGVAGWPRPALVAVYALNPFVALYAANGMTEAAFMTAIFLLTSALFSWHATESPGALLMAGLACALAMGIRYEVFALVLIGAMAIALIWWERHWGDWPRLEGQLLAFLAPFLYVLLVWGLANWMFMGSPTFFLDGPSSNAAQTEQFRHPGSELWPLYRHLGPAISFALARCLLFMPGLIPLLVLAAGTLALRRRPTAAVVLFAPAAVLLFHVYYLYAGQSFGWLRYYCYSVPLGLWAAALVVAHGPPPSGARSRRRALAHRWITIPLVMATVALSVPTTLVGLVGPAWGRAEHGVLDDLVERATAAGAATRWSDEQAMAAYIDGLRLPRGSVALDTQDGFAIPMYSHAPAQFIVSSDHDYVGIVAALPLFHGYVLVPRSSLVVSPILSLYPGLRSNTARWARLQRRTGRWLLYRIAPSTDG